MQISQNIGAQNNSKNKRKQLNSSILPISAAPNTNTTQTTEWIPYSLGHYIQSHTLEHRINVAIVYVYNNRSFFDMLSSNSDEALVNK